MEPCARHVVNVLSRTSAGRHAQQHGSDRIASSCRGAGWIRAGGEPAGEIEGGGDDTATILINRNPHISEGQLVLPSDLHEIQGTTLSTSREAGGSGARERA